METEKIQLEKEYDLKIGSVAIKILNNYDVPGGVFYREAYFFSGQDKIRLVLVLPIGQGLKYPDNKEGIKELLEKINQREVDKKTLDFMETFDELVQTLGPVD